MKSPLLKICGLQSVDDAERISPYCDMMGVVIDHSSRRCVSNKCARDIIASFNKNTFLVSTAIDLFYWTETVITTGASCVQIHNSNVDSYTVKTLQDMGVDVMVAFTIPSVSKECSKNEALKIMEAIGNIGANRILLDTGPGTGKVHDWDISHHIASKFDVMVAGGINPDNVGDMIHHVRPAGVDISSGVEGTSGRKDIEKIIALKTAIENASL